MTGTVSDLGRVAVGTFDCKRVRNVVKKEVCGVMDIGLLEHAGDNFAVAGQGVSSGVST